MAEWPSEVTSRVPTPYIKRFMSRLAKPEVPKRLPLRESEMPRGELRLIGKPVRPDQSEVQRNPRARSAIMRVAERLAA